MFRNAFTLVEVLIVVIVLGILAAAIVPQFTSAADDARQNAAAIVVKSMMRQIGVEKAKNGTYPTAIVASWFEGGVLPTNPYYPTATTTTEVVNTSGALHPADKVSVTNGAFWYNQANGVVRARVTAGANDAATIVTYNAVNSCNVTTIGQTN